MEPENGKKRGEDATDAGQADESPEKQHRHGHHYDIHAEEEGEAVHRLRGKHKQHRSKYSEIPQRNQNPLTAQQASSIPSQKQKKGKRRIIFWSQVSIVLLIFITAGLTIRAIEMATIRSTPPTWIDELKRGNIGLAIEKFSTTSSIAVSQLFKSDLTTESLMRDFNDALPHLKKAGYILIEMEVEVGIPPKLIPHFYHDGEIKLNLEKALEDLGDNSIGKALMIALAQAGELQKQIEVADMAFDYIEVELGPIPGLKLQYKNYYAVKKKLFK